MSRCSKKASKICREALLPTHLLHQRTMKQLLLNLGHLSVAGEPPAGSAPRSVLPGMGHPTAVPPCRIAAPATWMPHPLTRDQRVHTHPDDSSRDKHEQSKRLPAKLPPSRKQQAPDKEFMV